MPCFAVEERASVCAQLAERVETCQRQAQELQREVCMQVNLLLVTVL